jgi:hypothetical protein
VHVLRAHDRQRVHHSAFAPIARPVPDAPVDDEGRRSATVEVDRLRGTEAVSESRCLHE